MTAPAQPQPGQQPPQQQAQQPAQQPAQQAPAPDARAWTAEDARRRRRRDGAAYLTRAEFDDARAQAPNGEFWLRDTIPLTGIGRFDARYRPFLGELAIEVKVFWEFCQSAPVGGPSVAGGNWDAAAQTAMVDDFKRQAEQAWSDRFKLVCTAPGFTDLSARVRIRVSRAAQRDQAHFHLRMAEVKGTTGWGQEQNDQVPGGPRIINVGNFARADATVRPHDSAATRSRMLVTAQGVVQQLLEVHQVNPLRFLGDGTDTLDAASTAHLDAFAAAYAARLPGSPAVPLVVIGKSGKKEKAAAETARARTATAALTARALPLGAAPNLSWSDRLTAAETAAKNAGTYSRAEKKARAVDLKARADACEAIVETEEILDWAGEPYSIFAHEFGHMLGNPDEYFEYASAGIRDGLADHLAATGDPFLTRRAATVRAAALTPNDGRAFAQEAFLTLADNAGLIGPEFGPVTASIMSAGTAVQPFHYTPIWHAMTEIMQGATPAGSWRIVPV